MADDIITLKELLKKFKLKIDLPEQLLNYELDDSFLKADLNKKKNEYLFKIDDVTLTIKPENKKETIQRLLILNGEVKGGVIIGYDSIQYLN